MEGSDGRPDTSSRTGPDLVVPSRARGWEQGEGPGLVQAGFHLGVREPSGTRVWAGEWAVKQTEAGALCPTCFCRGHQTLP